MLKFTRLQAPEVLTTNWEGYGKRYKQNRIANIGFSFVWPIIEGITLNKILLPTLLLQTQDHCSYCDHFPLRRGDNTIDHFKPKSIEDFHHLVCNWENLYIACKHCQDSKGSLYSENLLRPDEITYSFSKYFIYNYALHKLEANETESLENQFKATETIRIFDFNHLAQIKSRKFAYDKFVLDASPVMNDYNYRFILLEKDAA